MVCMSHKINQGQSTTALKKKYLKKWQRSMGESLRKKEYNNLVCRVCSIFDANFNISSLEVYLKKVVLIIQI